MLHILFVILKIIGIIIGILLAFLLLLLLFAVFLPVQYRLDAEKDSKWKAAGRISWLFRIFVFSVQYQEEEITTRFCIFGIPFKLKNQDERERKKEKPKKKRTAKEEEAKLENTPGIEEKTETKAADAEEIPSKKKENRPDPEEPEKETDSIKTEAKNQEKTETEIPPFKETFWDKCRRYIRNFIEKIRRLPNKAQKKFRKIKFTFQNFCDKIGDIRNKITEIKELLNDESNIAAFLLCKEQLFILLKHIGPRKMKGKVEFGFEDPADTGYVLGCISVLYAAVGAKVQICPNFEEVVFEGNLMVKGHVQLFVLLKIAWKLYRDKNIKQLYKKFKS